MASRRKISAKVKPKRAARAKRSAPRKLIPRASQPGPLVVQVIARGQASVHALPAEGEVVIGKSPGANVSVKDPSLAAEHAALLLGPQVMVRSLGGKTRIGGRTLGAGQRALVLPGEPVELGGAVVMLSLANPSGAALPVGPEELHEVVRRACGRADETGGDALIAHVRPDDSHDAGTARAAVREALEPEDNLVSDVDGSHWVVASAGAGDAALLLAGMRSRLQALRVKAAVGFGRYRAVPDPEGLIRAARDELHPFEVQLKPEMVAASAPLRDVYRMAAHAAPSDISVLLLGESGVGKGVVAEHLHRLSKRRKGPFVHAKSGAIGKGDVVALLKSAASGTLFFEEIGATAPEVQRLLAKELAKLKGSRRPRLVASSHRDLSEEVKGGQFSKPLSDAVAQLTLVIPALRDRRQEIEPLCQAFAGGAELTPAALDRLLRYSWPGNVRELKLVIERARLDADGGSIDVPNLGLDPVRYRHAPAAG